MVRPIPINREPSRIRYAAAELISEGVASRRAAEILQERFSLRTLSEAQRYITEGRQAHRLAEALGAGNIAAAETINAALPEGGEGRRVFTVRVSLKPSDPTAVEPEGGWPVRTVRVLINARQSLETAQQRIEQIVNNWNEQYGGEVDSWEFLSVVES